eukprot:s1188_g12.t1
MLPIMGSSCADLMLPISDNVNLGFPSLLHSTSSPGPSLSASGMGRSGFQLPTLDCESPDPILPLQSMARLGLSFSAFGLSCSDLPVPIVDFLRSGFPFLLRGPGRTGPPVSLFSRVAPGLAMFISDFSEPESPPFSRSPGRSGLAVPISGLGCIDSSVLVLDSVGIDSLALLRSLA